MRALTFLIRLKTPLLATQTESGEPNSATTFAYIPGSMIRGAVIAQLPRATREVLALDDKLRAIYLDGAARFLNAYPAHPKDKTRLLPMPLSWRMDKRQAKSRQADIFDFAVKPNDELETPKRPKLGEFVWLNEGAAALYSPDRQVTVHNASEDRNRKQAQTSTVYRYEALAKDQVFTGAILGDERVLNEIGPLLKHVSVLGGSRTGGYGLVAVEEIKQDEWAEYAADPDHTLQGKVIITLLSDAILRKSDGHLTNTLDDALGATATPELTFAGDLRVAGGFNRTWGLPLNQDWAIPAGSVFVYPASALDPLRLEEACADGIGERRGEGLGRIAVNWHARSSWAQVEPASWKQAEPGKPQPSDQLLPLTDEARQLAQRMAQRQWRAALEAALVERVAQAEITRVTQASSSQLTRVRVAAREALFKKDMQPIVDHLTNLSEKGKEKVGARQLSDVRVHDKRANDERVNNQPLLTWLKTVSQLSQFENEFKTKAPSVAGRQAQADDKLRAEYLARLIDGVLKKAVKQIQTPTGAQEVNNE